MSAPLLAGHASIETATRTAEALKEELAPACERIEIAGSVRRRKSIVALCSDCLRERMDAMATAVRDAPCRSCGRPSGTEETAEDKRLGVVILCAECLGATVEVFNGEPVAAERPA